MEFLRIAGATLNQTPLDVTGNLERVLATVHRVRREGVRLLCLPELCLSGYGCEDAFFSAELSQACERAVAAILPHTGGLTVVVGFPTRFQGALYNCAGVLQDGRILGIHPKRALAREGVHYEPRWFHPWAFGRREEKVFVGGMVPFGDFVYNLGSIGMAIEICEEAWSAIPGAAALAQQVHLVVNPSASHFALGKYRTREHLVANSSRALHATYLYTNLLGCEAGRLIYDGGVLIAEKGRIVARGPRFGFQDGFLTAYDCFPEGAATEKIKHQSVTSASPDVRRNWKGPRESLGVQGADPRQLTSEGAGFGVAAGDQQKSILIASSPPEEEPYGEPAAEKSWEFLQAQMLGLFDYLRKSGHQGFVVSLSGGVDSTCCAVLVAHMVAAVLRQLGPQELARRLGLQEPGDDLLRTQEDRHLWVRRLLLCVYQKTAQSGPVTETAAREVARELGCEFHLCEVEAIVQSYLTLAERSLGAPLTWKEHDIALQNIQARVRSPLPWLFANLRRSLLLTTSNRSEAAVGYATMDGDTAGGLAPLAGIDKPFLRQWLRWAESPDHRRWLPFGALVSLGLVNVQTPTAELRPAELFSKSQTDEDDLMPYPVLEQIERYYIRDRLSRDDILQLMMRDFPEYPKEDLQVWVDRFVSLWARSQWKRERFVPSFHLDEISLDPKSYCRFPILSKPTS